MLTAENPFVEHAVCQAGHTELFAIVLSNGSGNISFSSKKTPPKPGEIRHDRENYDTRLCSRV
jgi:hypothetical protein